MTPIQILEEMIEKYSEDPTVWDWSLDYSVEVSIQDARQSILEEAKSRIQAIGDGWISVSDRLPEEKEVILFYDDTGIVHFGKFMWNARWKSNYDVVWPIIWWMPIPTITNP